MVGVHSPREIEVEARVAGLRTARQLVDRTRLGRLVRAAIGRPMPIQARRGRARPRLLQDFRFFAVLGTWMEADIVAACVQNALAQGCERVFLVDNDSADETVRVAVAAGATLVRSFSTRVFDEVKRFDLMNRVVGEASVEAAAEHVWWLWLDADEFPHGTGGETIRAFLSRLDDCFRVVGARYFNHYPSNADRYVVGAHPLDSMPMCEELRYPWCASRHYKHPLQRFDRTGPPIVASPGFHIARSGAVLKEPREAVFVHHFPYREEVLTRRRLAQLAASSPAGASRAAFFEASYLRAPGDSNFSRRLRSLDAVYAGRWQEVERPRTVSGPSRGVTLRRWTDVVDPADAVVSRWY